MVDFNRLLNRSPSPPDPVPELITAITGHRPDKLPDRVTGYKWDNPVRVWCREQIRQATQRILDDAKRRHAPAGLPARTPHRPARVPGAPVSARAQE